VFITISTELSRKLGLRQKTCWKFKGKAMKAMESRVTTKSMAMPKLTRLLLVVRKKELLEEKTQKKKKNWLYLPLRGTSKELAVCMGRLSKRAVKKNLVNL